MELNLRSLYDVKEEWKYFYVNTPEVSPFLEYEALAIAWKYFYPYYITGRCKPKVAQFIESGQIVALIPLTIRGEEAQLFGAPNGFNESGALFENPDILPDCFRLLHQKFKSIDLLKVDERSPLSELRPDGCVGKPNVAICFGADYDAYFKSLTSSVRQNIRTSYNRLEKDGHSYELNVYTNTDSLIIGGGKMLPVNEIINLYCTRHQQRYGVKTTWLKKWFLKHQNFATLFYRRAPNAITLYLTIDQTPAAFMSGLWCQDRLIIPRLSINESFKRYSPGMVLICESIKYLMTNTPIKILDLSQGEEPYKYKLGGKTHYSFNFRI